MHPVILRVVYNSESEMQLHGYDSTKKPNFSPQNNFRLTFFERVKKHGGGYTITVSCHAMWVCVYAKCSIKEHDVVDHETIQKVK